MSVQTEVKLSSSSLYKYVVCYIAVTVSYSRREYFSAMHESGHFDVCGQNRLHCTRVIGYRRQIRPTIQART